VFSTSLQTLSGSSQTTVVALASTVLSLYSKLVIVTGSYKLVKVRQVHSLTHNKSTIVDIPSGILYKQDRLQVMTTGIRAHCPYVSRLLFAFQSVRDRPCTTFVIFVSGRPLRLDENENETASFVLVFVQHIDFPILTAPKNQLNTTPFMFFWVFLPKPTKLPPQFVFFWSGKPKRTKRSRGYQMDKQTAKQRKTDDALGTSLGTTHLVIPWSITSLFYYTIPLVLYHGKRDLLGHQGLCRPTTPHCRLLR
jgi:hypothetical protein